MRMKCFAPVAMLCLLVPVLAGALDAPSAKVQDDSALRISLVQPWFKEAPGRVLGGRSFIHTLPGGGRVQVRAEAGQEEFKIVLARERDGAFPGWAQGSWVLYRAMEDGALLRIRYFPRSDRNTYVQFRPFDSGKSHLDVMVYDAYAARSLPVPLAFERLLTVPVEEALRLAGAMFPRRYFDPRTEDYREVRRFAAAVREALPGLNFRDDGAIDEAGRYVFINDGSLQEGTPGLNCSGFAKWLVDGLLRPVTGQLLSIDALKAAFGERGSSFTDVYERARDPFFGLDWTRNLASQANAALRSPVFGELREIEVQEAQFASVVVRSREGAVIRSYPGFLSQAGFGAEGLQPLLYTLAIDEPGRIYLASVNTELTPRPLMRQHFHVAALVPFFDEGGDFKVLVFESAEETSFSRFNSRYPGHYINLVRIPVVSSWSF